LDNDTELKEYPSERRQNIANQKKFQRVKWILLVMVLFIAVRRDQLPLREIPQRVGQIHSGGIGLTISLAVNRNILPPLAIRRSSERRYKNESWSRTVTVLDLLAQQMLHTLRS